ncbi:MAG: Tad domain-containing protein [Sulfuricella sp.]|nr:Tad domain-containing protein [Sulfuricella sp.]
MKTGASLKNRQGGAVAVMVGIGMVMLVGFLALVIDLGHLYIAKTELQNGADAAALAGAKELKGTALGVTSAIAMTQQLAGKNYYDLGSKKIYDTTDAETQNDIIDIWVGNCPEDTCMVAASSITTDAAAANKYFIKVHTRQRDLAAWFAPIFNLVTGGNYSITSTFGMAVAGRYLIDITPLAMCALDLSKCPACDGTCSTPPCDCGYEKGKTYKVSDINPIGPGTLYWLDPLATTSSCTVTSADDTRPFVCQGKASVATTGCNNVYTNTGISGPLLAALDSRFNDYDPQAQCDPATAPPDTNVREYLYTDNNTPGKTNWWNTGDATQEPTQQAANVISRSETLITTDWSGVVWSFVRPPSPNTTGRSVNASYPSSPLTPYTDSNFSTAPTGGGAASQKAERRVMNLVIVECPSVGGVCRPAPVRGIGKFLLQRRANTPSDKEIYVEFGQFVPGGPNVTDIKLYR